MMNLNCKKRLRRISHAEDIKEMWLCLLWTVLSEYKLDTDVKKVCHHAKCIMRIHSAFPH